MHGLRHAIHTQFKGLVEAVTPAPTVSQFEEKRLLTPEEFVAAGDHLVSTVGSWAWSACQGKAPVPFLPQDKQFLVTRNVPCRKRATALYVPDEEVETGEAGGDEDAWVCAQSTSATGIKEKSLHVDSLGDDDDDEDTYRPPETGEEKRAYDLYITYSKYYQVPQFWLVGHSQDKLPLPIKLMEQDINSDYIRETVTVDPFPHIDKLTTLSIHPCKHAQTMKVFGDQQVANGKEFRVQHYLILFLKFISGVVPTIEYDYSMEYSMG